MLHVTGGVAVNQIVSSPSQIRFAEELDFFSLYSQMLAS